MIRIESNLQHDLNIPLPAQPGQRPRYLLIPAATPAVFPQGDKPGVPGKPGVIEVEFIDAVTLARLQWHYSHRPRNVSEPDGDVLEIGLLKFTIEDEVA